MTGSALEEQPSTQDLLAEERCLHVGSEQPIRISTGHRILHHQGKCSRPHGHNYRISVEVTGEVTEEGWVVDKGEITSILAEWDHKFLVEVGDPLIEAFKTSGDEDCLVVLEYPPTAEVMSLVLERPIQETLPETVSDVAVKVKETSELCASY